MGLNEVITRIRAQDDTAKGLKSADNSIKGFAKRTAGAFKGLLGPIAALGSVAGIGLVTKKMFEVGSAAIETRSKFDTVFGPVATAQMDTFNKAFGRLSGISQTNLSTIPSPHDPSSPFQLCHHAARSSSKRVFSLLPALSRPR